MGVLGWQTVRTRYISADEPWSTSVRVAPGTPEVCIQAIHRLGFYVHETGAFQGLFEVFSTARRFAQSVFGVDLSLKMGCLDHATYAAKSFTQV